MMSSSSAEKFSELGESGGEGTTSPLPSAFPSSLLAPAGSKKPLTRPKLKARSLFEGIIVFLLCACGCVSILTTLGIVGILALETSQFFREVSIIDFFTDTQWTPLFADKHFGIAPLLCGTLLTSFVALAVAVPLGLIIAVYLSEFAGERTRAILKPLLELLAGIPTIVFGYFALIYVTPFLQRFFPDLSAFNALSAGIVMGFMILPMIASLSEDALYVVPGSLREGAYALGASRIQMIFSVLVPAALGGITAAFILGVSRAVGETMIVAIAAGQEPVLTLNPMRAIETMTAYIVQISLGDTPHGTLEFRTIFAVGTALFLMTLLLNFVSLRMKERYQKAFR